MSGKKEQDLKEQGPTKADNITPLRPTRPCPECGKPSTRESYPFCSHRCKSIDLHRWLSGAYVIPGKPLGEEDEEDG
ncbi:DNA gyrase inhibitor YacG [Daeguia caeni]|uniref:DNA gyrase inhibitor YacG n=1 Tax=Daeguia caeni TaxID=439612 RepID=A0ABV9H580_9HYPH